MAFSLLFLSPFPLLQGSDETIRVVSMDRDFHVDCYHCEVGLLAWQAPAIDPEERHLADLGMRQYTESGLRTEEIGET